MSYLEQALLADGVTADGRIVASLAMIEHAKNANILSLDGIGANNGSGYVVGETFDIVGGTAVSINGVSVIARGVVVAIAGDDVTEVKITSSGIYTALPGTTDVATTNASGRGHDPAERQHQPGGPGSPDGPGHQHDRHVRDHRGLQ